PPLLYSGAFFTSLRDLRANKRPISLLAFGLVGATMATVGVVAHEWVHLSWAVAFTLGAIVSPTDALAATEITRRLGAPRRIVSIIEGESLVNDGTALVLYKAAIGAAVGATFSLADTSGRVVLNVIGGIAIGLGVGWTVRQIRRRLDNPPIEVAIAVLSGYLAYLPADAAGVSGVLAAVTIGVYMGWYTPELTNERTRLSGDAFWEIFVFLVNALALPTNFPDRGLILFLTFAVIVATLVLQGLTLPALIRVLDVSDDGGAEREEAKARIHAAEAALARLEELLAEGTVREDT